MLMGNVNQESRSSTGPLTKKYSTVPLDLFCPNMTTPLKNGELSSALADAASSHNIDAELLAAVMIAESGCRIKARSRDGALGLMQLMPSTAKWLGVPDPFSVRDNVFGGAKYLSMLIRDFDGDLELALAAYNAGPYKVHRLGRIPHHRETRVYVKRVLEYYDTIKQHTKAEEI